jgi:hypothetical protein
MAVGTFKPIAKLLARAGVASPLADGYWRFDMRRYLDLVARKTRWNELPGNTVYPARKCRRERQQPPADPPAPHVPARRHSTHPGPAPLDAPGAAPACARIVRVSTAPARP